MNSRGANRENQKTENVRGWLSAAQGTSLETFVTTAQIQLLSRITKTGWLDSDDAHREIVNDIMNFLKQPNTTHYHVGLKIFNQLVTEMNQQSPGKA